MSLFDGMAGILTDVFGAPVTYTPAGGAPVQVSAVFRAAPIEVSDGEGHTTLITAPTLRVRRDILPGLRRDDRVEPSIRPGEVYEVINVLPTASPASDAFVIAELERID